MNHCYVKILSLLLVFGNFTAANGQTFQISSIRLLSKDRDFKTQEGVRYPPLISEYGDKVMPTQCEVRVSTNTTILSKDLYVRAYFYDPSGNITCRISRPYPANHFDKRSNSFLSYDLPIWFKKDSAEYLYFLVDPDKIRPGWKLLVVVGNSHEIAAKVYPSGFPMNFDFEEKSLLSSFSVPKNISIPTGSSTPIIIEKVIETGTPAYPRFTLFLILPPGVTKGEDVQGILALSMVGNSIPELRAKLVAFQQGNASESMRLFKFASDNKLAVLAWGAKRLWEPGANFDKLQLSTKEDAKTFKKVGDSWAQAVAFMCRQYHLPINRIFLNGESAGAGWAVRLAMLHPEMFVAVHAHIAPGYVQPLVIANRIMWLVTTGTSDSGYENSLLFLRASRALGYPIIFKAENQLGHDFSAGVDALTVAFFQYAFDIRLKPKVLPNHSVGTSASPIEETTSFGNIKSNVVMRKSEINESNKNDVVPLPNTLIKEAWLFRQ